MTREINMQKAKEKKSYITLFCGLDIPDAEDRALIVECQRYEQEISNRIWMTWMHESLADGKDANLRIFLELYKRWKENGEKGPRPKLEFYAIENDFQSRITNMLRETHPCYNSRCITLTVQRVLGCIRNNTSHTGRLKLWQAVLLGRERLAAFDDRIAVPFDKQNGKLELRGDETWLTVRIDRREVAGKVNATSKPVAMRLRTERMSARFALLLSQAAQGLREWKGSKLSYSQKKRRFTLGLVVEADPPRKPIAQGGVGKLTAPTAEEKGCWRLEIPLAGAEKIVRLVGRHGNSIAYLRRRLEHERGVRSRPSFPGARRKNRTKTRWLVGDGVMQGLWERKTKQWNYLAAAEIVRHAVKFGLSAIELEKPTAKSLLNTAGGDIPAWPVFQFCEIIERKAREVGVELRFTDAKNAVNDDG
jgi:hypothetical protein